jgi:membrane protease YdiL (CAAX protease family)
VAEGAEPVDAAPAETGARTPAPAPDALPRPTGYRGLQVASLLLIAVGVVVSAAVVQTTPGILSGADSLADDVDRAVAILGWLVIGGLALLVGLLANLARAVVVREKLPENRYRGPSIIALVVLAVIAANLAVVSAAGDVAALLGDGELTTLGTLVILTVTQLGLVGVAALFVMAPRALAGVRLLPARGVWRSIGLGLLLSVPAWIGAQVIGVVVIYLLETIGLQPEAGLADEALSRADPVILVLALVVVAPIAEEVFFRGVAYNAWLREYGASRALFGSAILFGFIHGSVFLFLPIVALGIVLALVYRSTGSLPAAIALHAGFNGITVVLALLMRFGVLDLPIT